MSGLEKRRPSFAVVLSMLMPGLGHVYSGRAIVGSIYYLGYIIVIILALILFAGAWVTLPSFLMLLMAYNCIVLVSAIRAARNGSNRQPYQRWYVYGLLVATSLLIINPLLFAASRLHVVQVYKVASSDMLPSVSPGDSVVVNKFYYRFHELQREDIVAFQLHVDPTITYLKRVVGLPGETIALNSGSIWRIDNTTQPTTTVGLQHSQHEQPLAETTSQENQFIHIPADSVFLLGDNRDMSRDRRNWEIVALSDIQGKVSRVYSAK